MRRAVTPDYALQGSRTRVEIGTTPSPRSILVIKPDQLGDFIMALGALAPFPTVIAATGRWSASRG